MIALIVSSFTLEKCYLNFIHFWIVWIFASKCFQCFLPNILQLVSTHWYSSKNIFFKYQLNIIKRRHVDTADNKYNQRFNFNINLIKKLI